MFNLDFQAILKDLIFPAVVAVLAAFFSYRGAYALNEAKRKEDEARMLVNLIDSMNLDIDKLISVLESLKEDAEKLRFFSLTNTRIARDITTKLRGYFFNITLFKDDKFRKEIVITVDIIDSLINEMDLIENHIVNKRARSEEKREYLEKTLMEIKLRLLEQDYFIDKNDGYKPKSVKTTNEVSDKKADAIDDILGDLVNSLKVSQDEVADLDRDYEKKRSFIVIKILDAQTKLRELSSKLIDQK